jgi:hypothetical protein
VGKVGQNDRKMDKMREIDLEMWQIWANLGEIDRKTMKNGQK